MAIFSHIMPTELGTISGESETRGFRFCRGIKRYSISRCNLAVVWTVWPVIDTTFAISDNGIG